MLLVMVAIGGTDILFALDSIPAIFGLTQSVYLVFTATAFSLLGLRQLYFLLDGLLDRLIFLSYGLAAILAFIGVKLILHALHENNVPFINNGEHIDVVEISTGVSLGFIILVLIITVVASLVSPKGRAQTYVAAARRHAHEFLDIEQDPAYCDKIFHKLLQEEQQIRTLPEKYRKRIREEDELMDLLRKAHRVHEERVEAGVCFVPPLTLQLASPAPARAPALSRYAARSPRCRPAARSGRASAGRPRPPGRSASAPRAPGSSGPRTRRSALRSPGRTRSS